MGSVQRGTAILLFMLMIAAGSLVVSKPALAEFFFSVSGSSPREGCANSASTPVSTGCGFAGFGGLSSGTGIALANANLGGVGATATNTLFGIPLATVGGVISAMASARVEYVLDGVSPCPGCALQASLLMTVTGGFDGGCPVGWRCTAFFEASGNVSGLPYLTGNAGQPEERNGGFFAGRTGIAENFRSPEFDYLPGVPFSVLYQVDVAARVENLGEVGIGSISSSFSETFGPARTGPVFDLPEGFTASGPCVENNRFVCADDGTPRQVPASGSLALLTLGLAGLAVWRRGRG